MALTELAPARRKPMRPILLLAALALISVSLTDGQAADNGEPTTAPAEKPQVKLVDTNRLRLILPPEIPAVPGRETNLYFDNVILTPNSAMYHFDVDCPRGTQQQERYTWTPTPADVGQYRLRLRVYNLDEVLVGEGTTIINVHPADAGAGRPTTMLLVGDSLTNAAVYSGELLALCQGPGNPVLKLIGSPGPGGRNAGENRHEGYGGWTARGFVTMWGPETWDQEGRRARSPFLYEQDGKPVLDFAKYCEEHSGGQAPDIITIFLGCNDTFGATEDTIEQSIDVFLASLEALIREFHRVRPDTKIGVISLVPPAATQDATGAITGCGQTRWQYRRNQHRVLERSRQAFAGREAENLFVIPAYVNLDCVHNYPTQLGPANARSPEIQISRQCNDVHPTVGGYQQIADTVYCWLKGLLAAK
jgi:lysophospholipase L1-like esterase